MRLLEDTLIHDLGSIQAALDYAEKIARMNGEHASEYRAAAEKLEAKFRSTP